MKFPKHDIPESIFLELSGEDFLFCLPESEPVSVFLDEFTTIPLPDPVPEIIPEHRPDDRREDREEEMISSPESSDKDHHIHPGNRSTDDRERLNTRGEKCDQIVPVSKWLDKLAYPLNPCLDPLGTSERDDEEGECDESEYYREKFRDKWESSFDHEREALWCF